jgi:hypothetical protein
MLKRKHIQEVIIMDSKKVIRDESLLEVAGGKWTYETLTQEEKDEFSRVSQALTDEWDYVGYNDFIRRMNAKYGE